MTPHEGKSIVDLVEEKKFIPPVIERILTAKGQNFTNSFFVDKLGVDIIYGSARLGPNRTVIVTSREFSETERAFTAEKILIATGSLPFYPVRVKLE